jgi:hypothetical protein
MYKKSSLIVIAAVIILFTVCVAPVAAYANYEYIWTSSGNQFVQEYDIVNGNALNAEHFADYFQYNVKSVTYAFLTTPFVNSGNKNGVHPKVRYLWFALKMPVGVHASWINVFNGPTDVYYHSVNWEGTGVYKEYPLDMGSYKDMNRGINTALRISNTLGTDQTVYTYGAGAKEEW